VARSKGATVKIEGADKLAKKLKALPQHVREGAARAVKQVTLDTANDMRRRAPRDTGALQESIVAETKTAKGPRPSGIARATSPYAHIVNDGSSTRRPDPFATVAAEHARREFPRAVVAEVRKVEKGVSG
jgi:HK97 gp10 family phage protein